MTFCMSHWGDFAEFTSPSERTYFKSKRNPFLKYGHQDKGLISDPITSQDFKF